MRILVIFVGVVLAGFILNYFYPFKQLNLQIPVWVSPLEIRLDSNKLWELVQNWRVDEGLSRYTTDNSLCLIAEAQVQDKIEKKHQYLSEKYADYPYRIYENIATAISEENILKIWLSLDESAAYLEKPMQYSCLKCLGDSCVQIFSNFETR